MLTQEKADQITSFLSRDIDHARVLLEMEPAEALAEVNAAGIECSLDDIKEYGKVLCSAMEVAQKGEFSEEDLDQVAGGVVITAGLILGLAGCLVAGAAVGGTAVFVTYQAVKRGW